MLDWRNSVGLIGRWISFVVTGTALVSVLCTCVSEWNKKMWVHVLVFLGVWTWNQYQIWVCAFTRLHVWGGECGSIVSPCVFLCKLLTMGLSAVWQIRIAYSCLYACHVDCASVLCIGVLSVLDWQSTQQWLYSLQNGVIICVYCNHCAYISSFNELGYI